MVNAPVTPNTPMTPHAIQVVPPPISVPRIEPDVASASGSTAGTGVQSVRSVPPRDLTTSRSGLVLAASAALGVFAAIGIVLAFLAIRARHAAANGQAAMPPPAVSAPAPAVDTAPPPPVVTADTPTDVDVDPAPGAVATPPPEATSSPLAASRPLPPPKTIAVKPVQSAAPAKTGKKRIDDGF